MPLALLAASRTFEMLCPAVIETTGSGAAELVAMLAIVSAAVVDGPRPTGDVALAETVPRLLLV